MIVLLILAVALIAVNVALTWSLVRADRVEQTDPTVYPTFNVDNFYDVYPTFSVDNLYDDPLDRHRHPITPAEIP